MITRKELEDLLEARGQQAIILDDFDDAIEGYTEVAGEIRVIYDYEKCIKCLVDQDGLTYEDAVDTFSYNTLRALPYMGVIHPLILYRD